MPRQKTEPGAGGVNRLAAMLGSDAMRGQGRKSSLTRWLLAHHDEFAVLLGERQPSWEDVATALAAMGLRDGTAKPPNGERVRKAWWSARRQAAAGRTRQAPKPPASRAVSDESPAPVPRLDRLPTGVEAVQPSRPRPRLDIQPATRLSGLPIEVAAPIGPVSSSGQSNQEVAKAGVACNAPTDDDRVAEELGRVLGQMQVGRIPLPKVVS
jgi:hypothetical protein